jgi:hypothetical protein
MSKLLLVLAIAACGGATKPTTTPAAHDGSIDLAWRAADRADHFVDVTLVVAGKPVALGVLNPESDSGPPTPAECAIRNGTPTHSEFWCGGTPAFNYFAADLKDGNIVVTVNTGVTLGPNEVQDEKHKEVTRVPAAGASLAVQPYAWQPTAK